MLAAKRGGARGGSNIDGQIGGQIMQVQKNGLSETFREVQALPRFSFDFSVNPVSRILSDFFDLL